jgi:uncharacterized protein YqjF (DUF2071 family)
MLHVLKRHLVPIEAEFGHCLVLTYALPAGILAPLLYPGLALDTYGSWGFLAVAMVETKRLRPAFLPRPVGRDFFLCGYRVFTRFAAPGSSMRGLRILRSDTDRRLMSILGNFLTHYAYGTAQVRVEERDGTLSVELRRSPGRPELHVVADLRTKPAPLPDGSPFASLKDARRYAGPLPFTFGYEKETHSLIVVRGVRSDWDPQPVRVDVRALAFLESPPFGEARALLANAFHMQGVPYRWERGVRYPLPRPGA